MPVVPIVLAAGASSRMGRPKALLDFDGRTCLDLVLAACADGGAAAPIVVIGPTGEAIRARLGGMTDQRAVPVVNPHPELGQLSSIQAGVAALPPEAEAFLVFPVDYPLVRGQDVRSLIEAFSGRPAGFRVFIPSHDRRRGHPMLIDAALAPELLALPWTLSARALLAAHAAEIRHVEVPSDRVLVDMDTPDDYQRCLRRYRAG